VGVWLLNILWSVKLLTMPPPLESPEAGLWDNEPPPLL